MSPQKPIDKIDRRQQRNVEQMPNDWHPKRGPKLYSRRMNSGNARYGNDAALLCAAHRAQLGQFVCGNSDM
jgi:hypothetical protein